MVINTSFIVVAVVVVTHYFVIDLTNYWTYDGMIFGKSCKDFNIGSRMA